MSRLVPEAGFSLVCPDGVTPALVRAYHDRLREAERELAPKSRTTPLADRLDTATTIEQSIPGEVLAVTHLEPELLAALDPEAVVAILDPPGPGFARVTDSEPLAALLDELRHCRDAYLAAHDEDGSGASVARSASADPETGSRIVTPPLRFAADYVVPVEFAVERTACGIQWEFFREDDLREIRWPGL